MKEIICRQMSIKILDKYIIFNIVLIVIFKDILIRHQLVNANQRQV